MDLVDELRRLGVEEPTPAAPRPDPWADARRLCPDAILVRSIDTARGKQCFLQIARTKEHVAKGADLYDGATVIVPGPIGGAERERIVAEADAAWVPITEAGAA